MAHLTHISDSGEASMVDVSPKAETLRTATASGFIKLQHETLKLIKENGLKKGDVLAVARIAAIQAAKQTQLLIPLCHQIPLTKISVEFELTESGIQITTLTRTLARTGVEMEALTAASVAALTIYDMCKAVDSDMEIGAIKLLNKTKEQPGSE